MTNQITKSSKFPKSRLWDSLIQGFCIKRDNPDKAFAVLRDCLTNHGILPSSYSFFSILHRFVSKGNMSKAIEVVELMRDDRVKYPFDNFVSSALISGFCRIGKPDLAIGFFENALSSGGFRPNVVTYTALVSALCDLGRFKEVSDLVSRMEKEGVGFDVVFYSNWICGYLKDSELMKAFREHQHMVKKGINPDTISYTILIDGFSKEGYVEKAVGLLGKMIKNGVKPNLATYTAIIRGFCKKGKLEEAFNIFKKVLDMGIEVDEFIYATLIDGICREGDFDRVFRMLDEMEKTGISPSTVTYNIVISGLCKTRRTHEADEVSKGVPGDVVTYSTLLHGYIEEENVKGILETKQRFEEAGVQMDAIMCNILFKALFMVGAFEDAHALYKAMPQMDLDADSVTYGVMIDGYCRVGRIEEALEVFDEFRRTSISSLSCYRCIINALCKRKMLDSATEVLIELYEKDLGLDSGMYKTLLDAIFADRGSEGVLILVSRLEVLRSDMYSVICNGAISFLCKRGFSEVASEVYMVMRREGLPVTTKSYYLMLKKLLADDKMYLFRPLMNISVKEYGLLHHMVGKVLFFHLCLKDLHKALRLLEKIKETEPAFTIPATVFKKLVEDSRASDAYALVIGSGINLPVLDVVDYSIMVDGLCKEGYFVKAFNLCNFAESKGIILNIVTYNSAIHGLCRQGCLIEAFRLFDSLGSIGLVPSDITYAILIDSVCKEGFFLDAKKLLDKMIQKGLKPSIRIYNSIIDSYCRLRQIGEALNLLAEMETEGVTPDEFTVSALIKGCYQKGDMEEALTFFFEFKRRQILPDFLGFLYMTRGLCTKGRMEEARSILREMLQSKSVLELIDKVDGADVEPESVRNFLISLCEQGSIEEAITILEEIKAVFYPVQAPLSAGHGSINKLFKPETSLLEASWYLNSEQVTNVESNRGDMTEGENAVNNYGSYFNDFGFCYSLISSLCAKGELQKANRLVKRMLSGIHER